MRTVFEGNLKNSTWLGRITKSLKDASGRQDGSFEELKKSWIVTGKVTDNEEADGSCICGHKGIRYEYQIAQLEGGVTEADIKDDRSLQNALTKLNNVGSSCITQFQSKGIHIAVVTDRGILRGEAAEKELRDFNSMVTNESGIGKAIRLIKQIGEKWIAKPASYGIPFNEETVKSFSRAVRETGLSPKQINAIRQKARLYKLEFDSSWFQIRADLRSQANQFTPEQKKGIQGALDRNSKRKASQHGSAARRELALDRNLKRKASQDGRTAREGQSSSKFLRVERNSQLSVRNSSRAGKKCRRK